MRGNPPAFKVGTSGWSYRHWSGVFYPATVKQARYLEYYLTRFDCVELNSSFYNLPADKTVKGWLERTPETFRFCPKLSRFITHQKRLVDPGEALHRYFSTIRQMKARMGPILIQIPPGLKYDPSLTTDFLEILKAQYHDFQFAFEVRDQSWIQDEFFELLSAFGVSFVIADSGSRFPYHEAVTARFVYLRFHGPEKLYASGYNDDILLKFSRKIVNWMEKNLEVWAFFNNDFGGYAVKNALRLKKMVRNG